MQISNSSLLFKCVAATEVTALCKNKQLLRTESLLIQTIFTEYRQQENLLMRVMSCIMPLLKDI